MRNIPSSACFASYDWRWPFLPNKVIFLYSCSIIVLVGGTRCHRSSRLNALYLFSFLYITRPYYNHHGCRQGIIFNFSSLHTCCSCGILTRVDQPAVIADCLCLVRAVCVYLSRKVNWTGQQQQQQQRNTTGSSSKQGKQEAIPEERALNDHRLDFPLYCGLLVELIEGATNEITMKLNGHTRENHTTIITSAAPPHRLSIDYL